MSGLWLCLWADRLPLDALADPLPHTVVYAQQGSRRWVIASADARVMPGEDLGSVQARFPELIARRRDPGAERSALETLACTAWAFSDRIVLDNEAPRGAGDLPFAYLALDVGPSLKLFGGLDALLRKLEQTLAENPCRLRPGVAPTPEAAALLARLGLPPAGQLGTLNRQLSGLPLDALRWPYPVLDLLHGSGHRCLGDLQRHSSTSLSQRLGPDISAALERLYGTRPDLRALFQPPLRYRRRMDLGAERLNTEALLFPAQRLLRDFQHYLEARHMETGELLLHCRHDGSVVQSLTLRSSRPTNDAVVLMRLLREHWNAKPPPGPVSELRLAADRFSPAQLRQSDLFDNPEAQPGSWDGVLDRLRARLGSAAVWQPAPADDHRPERAWSPQPTRPAREGQAGQAGWPPRPLWLLHKPQPLRSAPQLMTPAERIDTGWWDDAPVRRDYHWALGEHGERLWVYRDLDAGAGPLQWQLHGLGSPGETRKP